MCVILIKHWKQGYAITPSFKKKNIYSKLCCIVKFDELNSLAIFSCMYCIYVYFLYFTYKEHVKWIYFYKFYEIKVIKLFLMMKNLSVQRYGFNSLWYAH